MKAWARISTLTACVALAVGCDQQTEVQRQTHDLQEAQKNVAQVTQELEGELERAKADVIRLEQKVALARQGLTDDVLENQKELQAALQAQERRVSDELGQAKREAQIHSRDTEAALKQLGQAPAPAAAAPAEGMPLEPPPAAPAPPAASDAPREDLVPVRGSDTETTPEPGPVTPPATPTPAPPQPTSPVTDPTGAVPPLPPPAAVENEVAPSDPPPVEPAPAQP